MALWLCRLNSQEPAEAEEARQLGISAWVITVGVDAEPPSQSWPQAGGVPLVLEWRLQDALPATAEPRFAQRWCGWLRSSSAFRWRGRPLLMLRDSDCLSHPSYGATRLKAALESALGERIWLLQPTDGGAAGFDGQYEVLDLPMAQEVQAERANYEVHLREAHWRPAPAGWTIPAVRALSAVDQSRYANASPRLYCEWLQLLSRWSELQHNGAADAPVLLESFEGHRHSWSAALSPQRPMPLSVEAPPRCLRWGQTCPSNIALLIHGFYLDALAEMLQALPRDGFDLYVSTPLRQLPAAAALLRQQRWERVVLFGVPNRGRDLAPFLLQLLPAAAAVGHHGFIKLHTKSSPHLGDGKDWGGHLVNSLLDPAVVAQLRRQPPPGLLAPAGTLVPITLQLHNNAEHLKRLQRTHAVDGATLLGAQFIAGSMFAGRLSALQPLLKMELSLSDFEPEAGQTDGTLAHALERWIGVLAEPLEELPGDPKAMPGFGFRWSRHPGKPQTAIRMGSSQIKTVRPYPLIDSPQFSEHRDEGLFADQLAVADQLHQHGYAVLDLGRERMEALAARIRRDLEGQFDLEAWRAEAGQSGGLRLMDAWRQSEAVKEVALLPEVQLALQRCWGREPFAYQTLNFPVGTQQHLHSDAVHSHTEPPGFMCGVWVALEDIHPDSGPLEYVPGSQRLPYIQAADVGVRQQPGVNPGQKIFHEYWQTAIRQGGLQRETFTPRLGQALIWSANLIHGGSMVENLQRTRWSQVTHYLFEGCRYYTPLLSDWPEGPVSWRIPFDIARGYERGVDLDGLQALAARHGWSWVKFVPSSSEEIETALLEEAIASRESGAAAFSLELVEWALEAGFSSPWFQDNRARALVHLNREDEACALWKELALPHHSTALREAALEMLAHYGRYSSLEAALLQGDVFAADRCLDPVLEQGQHHNPADWQGLVATADRQGLMPLLLPLLEARLDSHPSQGLFRLIDGLRLLRGAAHLDQLLRVSPELLLAVGWRAMAGPLVLIARTSTGRWVQADVAPSNLRRPDVAKQLQLPALSDAGFLARFELEPGESLTQLWLQGHQQNLDVRDLRGLPYLGVVDHLLELCQAGYTPAEQAPALFDAGIGQALQLLAAPLQAEEHWRGLIQRRVRFGRQAPEAEITVVIPLYRRWDFMLGHVAGFSQDPWFLEQRVRLLYVIDDPTIETEVLGWCRGQLSDEPLDVTVISLQRNSGFALACNCGVLAAETPYVCLLNSDVLPILPGWLQPLFRTLLMVPEAMVAPLLLTDDGRIQHAGMTVQPLGLRDLPACVHTLKGLDPAQVQALSPDDLPYDVELLSGAALMFERRRFLELGGFNPVFGRGDFEDLDFSLRWRQAGGRLQLVPRSRLTHLERQSITHVQNHMAQWRGLINAWQAKALCPELA